MTTREQKLIEALTEIKGDLEGRGDMYIYWGNESRVDFSRRRILATVNSALASLSPDLMETLPSKAPSTEDDGRLKSPYGGASAKPWDLPKGKYMKPKPSPPKPGADGPGPSATPWPGASPNRRTDEPFRPTATDIAAVRSSRLETDEPGPIWPGYIPDAAKHAKPERTILTPEEAERFFPDGKMPPHFVVVPQVQIPDAARHYAEPEAELVRSLAKPAERENLLKEQKKQIIEERKNGTR